MVRRRAEDTRRRERGNPLEPGLPAGLALLKPMKILYATDGSECAAVAGRLLAALPLPAETEVTVLRAVPECWATVLPLEGEIGPEGSLYDLLAEIGEEARAAARRSLEAAAVPLRERGLRVGLCVCRQRPATAILEQAQAAGADLITVGSHGRGVLESFLLGSVSERVARYARCSVLVARGDQLRRVVIGVDGSASAAGALALLAALPLPADAELRVVHVLGPREGPPGAAGSEQQGSGSSDRQCLAADHPLSPSSCQLYRRPVDQSRADGCRLTEGKRLARRT